MKYRFYKLDLRVDKEVNFLFEIDNERRFFVGEHFFYEGKPREIKRIVHNKENIEVYLGGLNNYVPEFEGRS